MATINLKTLSPVIIGGIGGSGTKITAEILQELGYFLGHNLNAAQDNLLFSKIVRSKVILTEKMMLRFLRQNGIAEKFGWKEPNSHMALAELIQILPRMRYIHVIRNGKDSVCLPKIRRQYRRWHGRLGLPKKSSPDNLFQFWCIVNQNAIQLGELLGSQFMLLVYERLCFESEKQLLETSSFLKEDPKKFEILKDKIHPSKNIQIHKKFKHRFQPRDVEFHDKLLGRYA